MEYQFDKRMAKQKNVNFIMITSINLKQKVRSQIY